MKTIDLGDVAELEATVTNSKTGDLADPDTPAWKVVEPSGETAEPEATKVSKGVYICTFTPTEAGIHRLLFVGTGANQGAGESRFQVRVPTVPRD